ncbi:hypothetical protein D3C71_907430 [compost metagenome]
MEILGYNRNRETWWQQVGVEEIPWRYDTIQKEGSEELKMVISIITGGNRPGTPSREEEKNGKKTDRN